MVRAWFSSGGVVRNLFTAMLAGVAGSALQLQQVDLWSWPVYASIVLVSLTFIAVAALKNIAISLRSVALWVAMAALGFGSTGWRAAAFLESALPAALEGRDLVVTGVVTDMPQRNEAGLRFRLAVESAALDGQPTRLPPRMDVAWYGGREIRAVLEPSLRIYYKDDLGEMNCAVL